tara:strand:- start:136 stop:627 length:492 start_codon:yes stop_codon:yes gene_type:complete
MDFPDLTEYIGPIVFGLIAWLTNYFGKKKKPSEDNEIVKDKKEDAFTSDLNDIYKKIVSPENNEEEKVELEILSDEKEDNIINEIKAPLVEDILSEQQNQINEKAKIPKDQPLEKLEENTKNLESLDIELGEKPVDKIKEKIKSKTGLKEAFILKEILDRKYD